MPVLLSNGFRLMLECVLELENAIIQIFVSKTIWEL
jgi:hypothetical protein